MKHPAFFWALAASTIVTSVSHRALAQADAGEPLPPLESQQPQAPAAPHVPQVAHGDATICLAGDHAGVKGDSARAAFGIVCDALRNAGAPVAAVHETPGPATSAFRISLQRLERVIILRVTYESPVGAPVDSRSLTLNGLDEVLVASDRIAQALMQGKPIEQTATVDTLVGTETRQAKKKTAEAYWGVGLYGSAIPAMDSYAGGGLELPLWYETPSLAVGGSVRFSLSGGADTSDTRATFGSLSFGVRGFLGEGDIAGYFGGGLGFDWTNFEERQGPSSYFSGSSEGFGAHGELGVAFLRLHKTRFFVGARVDAPFFSTKMSGWVPPSADNPSGGSQTKSVYAMPISLNVTFMPFRI